MRRKILRSECRGKSANRGGIGISRQRLSRDVESEVLRRCRENCGQSIERLPNTTAQREALATMIAAAEKEIGDQAGETRFGGAGRFRSRRQVGRKPHGRGSRRDGTGRNQIRKAARFKKSNTIPRRLSRTVLGHEVHFQLQGGRVTYVPIDEFIDDVRADMRKRRRFVKHGR